MHGFRFVFVVVPTLLFLAFSLSLFNGRAGVGLTLEVEGIESDEGCKVGDENRVEAALDGMGQPYGGGGPETRGCVAPYMVFVPVCVRTGYPFWYRGVVGRAYPGGIAGELARLSGYLNGM